MRATRILLLCMTVLGFSAKAALAGVPELVGWMAIAIEDKVAQELELSDSQKAALLKLIDEREQLGSDLALSVTSLPPAEREAKLAPFRQESEVLGQAILTEEQHFLLGAILDARKTEGKAQPFDPNAVPPGEAPNAAPAGPPVAGKAPPVNTEVPKSEPAPSTLPARPAPPALPPPKDGKLRFNFRYAPWADVLDWFAQQADLSLVLDAPPPGTFNYTDPREYTPAEAIDVLNSILLTKGYTLVRRERMLMLVNLEDGVPPNLVTPVPAEELDERGEFELVSTLFPLTHAGAEEVEGEVRKLLGPQGSLVILPKAGQILVTETAGRLRMIRSVVNALENPDAALFGTLKQFPLEHSTSFEVLPVIRQLLNLPPDASASPDGSIRIAVDPTGTRILASGKPDRLAQLEDIIKALDVPGGGDSFGGPLESPQLEVYAVLSADPDSVLQVLQTVLAGDPAVRLAIDPKTGHLVALAKPSQHATIQATIAQMQRDAKRIEVIYLQSIDPHMAVLSVNKLFGGTGDKPSETAPKVDADTASNSLLVRGSEDQIRQIRELIAKLEDKTLSPGGKQFAVGQTTVRTLPITGRSAELAIEQAKHLWPSMRPNEIRMTAPSSVIRTMRTHGEHPAESRKEAYEPDNRQQGSLIPADPEMLRRLMDVLQQHEKQNFQAPVEPSQPAPAQETGKTPAAAPAEDKTTSAGARVPTRLASFSPKQDQAPDAEQQPPQNPAEPNQVPAGNAEVPPAAPQHTPPPGPPAPIIVSVSPSGITIASDDIEALNAFQELLTSLGKNTGSARELTVFYLKYAKASQAAELLSAIFGGGSPAANPAGQPPNPQPGFPAAIMGGGGGQPGNVGANLLGNLLGLGQAGAGGGGGGGGILTGGSVTIVPDSRMNALVIYAKPTDLNTAEQLLRIIDQEISPEKVQTISRPQLIPVYHTEAEKISGVVQQVFHDRLTSSTTQQLMQMLTQQQGQAPKKDETEKMSIGVDVRTNSLVVAAPTQLFDEVVLLVRQLDTPSPASTETTRVVALKRTNPTSLGNALSSVLGPQVRTGTTVFGQQNQNGFGQGQPMQTFPFNRGFGGGGFGGGGGGWGGGQRWGGGGGGWGGGQRWFGQ